MNFTDEFGNDQLIFEGQQDLVEVPTDDNLDIHPSDEEGDGDEDDHEMNTIEEEVPAPDMSFCQFRMHTDSVYCSAIHPSIKGLVITGGGDDKAYIWSFEESSEMSIDHNDGSNNSAVISSVKELAGHTDTITSVGFNFNGTLALTGSYDGTVRIWRLSDGEQLQVLEGPEDIEWAQWHSKGNAVIAGSRDGTVWMWLTHDGQCVQVFAGHDGSVSAGCFSTDGKLVCTGGEDGTVRIWMPKTGICRHVFDGQTGHEAMVTCLSSGGGGDFLLSGSADGTVRLFQLRGKRLLQSFTHSHPPEMDPVAPETEEGTDGNAMEEASVEVEGDSVAVECVGFAPPEWKWVASGGMDKNLKIWDTMTGNLRTSCAHDGGVVSLRWHSVAPVVCTAALDRNVRLWDARSGSLLQLLSGHTDLVTGLDFAPLLPAETGDMEDKRHVIISVSDDHTARAFLVDVQKLVSN